LAGWWADPLAVDARGRGAAPVIFDGVPAFLIAASVVLALLDDGADAARRLKVTGAT